MLDTNDVFESAVRGSSLHSDEYNDSNKSGMASQVVSMLLLAGIAYIGFNYYGKTTNNESLVIQKEIVAEIQIQPNVEVATNTVPNNSSEEAYLKELKSIESELSVERETLNIDPKKQQNLSIAMSNLVEDTTEAENTTYAKELKKEIGIDEEKSSTAIARNNTKEKARKIIIKKGDTLEGLSNKYYGDSANYKRIIASNENLHTTDDTIYAGEIILLPY